ncbi:MAG: MotA/TolQ/ExbB proton channel family protein, partial [Gammaproteobacteria bacterium]|nr:MotA/TolQ/ExbB proton channel family protein [Gammaproteobacteria bacterium]
TVVADDKPVNLDQLLDQVKRERLIEQEQNRIREAEFLQARDRQAQLLAQAKADLAAEERRTERLNDQFEENEFKLAEQESQLQERSGSLGELFGSVRQMANDSRAVIETSMTSVQYPERVVFLTGLSERKQQPTIDELRELWLVLQHEMTHSGKVEQFKAQVITANGEVAERDVTRVGVFTAFSDGKFLRYMSENRNLVELASGNNSKEIIKIEMFLIGSPRAF